MVGGTLPIDMAADPHLALRAAFCGRRQKDLPVARAIGKGATTTTCARRPLSRLRESAGVRGRRTPQLRN
jgi:hypothetical protein